MSGGTELDEDDYKCPICLSLLWKPILNPYCGHAACFWCLHSSMDPFSKSSKCPLCRQAYHNLFGVCEALHHFLERTFPKQYAAREEEVKAEEAVRKMASMQVPPSPQLQRGSSLALAGAPDAAVDFVCSDPSCGLLLHKPAVLVCGHAVCSTSCLERGSGGHRCRKCGVRAAMRPVPCKMLDDLLCKQFPVLYDARCREEAHREQQSQEAAVTKSGPCITPAPPRCPGPAGLQQQEEHVGQDGVCQGDNQGTGPTRREGGIRGDVGGGVGPQASAAVGMAASASAAAAAAAAAPRRRWTPWVALPWRQSSSSSNRLEQQQEAPPQLHAPPQQQGEEHESWPAGERLPLELDDPIPTATTGAAATTATTATTTATSMSTAAAASADGLASAAMDVATTGGGAADFGGIHAAESWTHHGSMCDACGMFPLIGRRYRCEQCPEPVGFDLCGECHDAGLQATGRFNQQHSPAHCMREVQPRFTMLHLLEAIHPHLSTAELLRLVAMTVGDDVDDDEDGGGDIGGRGGVGGSRDLAALLSSDSALVEVLAELLSSATRRQREATTTTTAAATVGARPGAAATAADGPASIGGMAAASAADGPAGIGGTAASIAEGASAGGVAGDGGGGGPSATNPWEYVELPVASRHTAPAAALVQPPGRSSSRATFGDWVHSSSSSHADLGSIAGEEDEEGEGGLWWDASDVDDDHGGVAPNGATNGNAGSGRAASSLDQAEWPTARASEYADAAVGASAGGWPLVLGEVHAPRSESGSSESAGIGGGGDVVDSSAGGWRELEPQAGPSRALLLPRSMSPGLSRSASGSSVGASSIGRGIGGFAVRTSSSDSDSRLPCELPPLLHMGDAGPSATAADDVGGIEQSAWLPLSAHAGDIPRSNDGSVGSGQVERPLSADFSNSVGSGSIDDAWVPILDWAPTHHHPVLGLIPRLRSSSSLISGAGNGAGSSGGSGSPRLAVHPIDSDGEDELEGASEYGSAQECINEAWYE